jgi:hypothetical protein
MGEGGGSVHCDVFFVAERDVICCSLGAGHGSDEHHSNREVPKSAHVDSDCDCEGDKDQYPGWP